MAGILTLLIAGLFRLPANQPRPVQAEDAAPPTPKRQAVLTIDTDLYEWWLIRWNDNKVRCWVVVDHEGKPTSQEIYDTCGPDIHEDWADTTACSQSDLSKCEGVYLYFADKRRGQKEVTVDLPPAEAWISLSGCQQVNGQNQCSRPPALVISGIEPLPNEMIVRIQGTIGGEVFSCPLDTCRIPLRPTGKQGISVEFWADSSFGDSSPHYTALVRVMPWGDFAAPEGPTTDKQLYYVDVLSSQWRGPRPASCSDVWQVFPEIGGPAAWLQTPDTADQLKSSISYYYLAGMLIRNGAADASSCPNGGLEDSGIAANACGVQVAMPQVVEWQNQFDTDILQTADDTGVPAQLMKNIFSRESQFWPGIYRTYREAGLGQLTDKGADTVLLWNESFYQQFCPLVLSQSTCEKRFFDLNDGAKDMLRGALVQKVNASCDNCKNGIDLTQVGFSVNVFAKGLQANCAQTGQTLENITQLPAGQVASYEDLWRFTLVNYNAGVGCLYNAVDQAWSAREPIDWQHVAPYLEPACREAIRYVEFVTEWDGPSLYTVDKSGWIPENDAASSDEDWTDEATVDEECLDDNWLWDGSDWICDSAQ